MTPTEWSNWLALAIRELRQWDRENLGDRAVESYIRAVLAE